MKHYPKTLRLLGGKEAKVKKVWYPMARNIWRVEYEWQDSSRGCLAELFSQHFEEVIPKSYKEETDG